MGITIPSFTFSFNVKRASVFLIVAFLWLPILAYVLGWTSRPLGGVEWSPKRPDWELDSVRNGVWQSQLTQWVEQNHPFRSDLIRANNQVVYWLFDRSTNYVVFGTGNQLYAYNHFEVFAGLKRREPSFFGRLDQRLHGISSILAAEGIPLIVVIAPNKVRMLPQFLPASLKSIELRDGDYLNFVARVRSVPVVDLMARLQEKKALIEGPVFANTGLHWNQNGVFLSMPTLDSALAKALGSQPQGFFIDGGVWDDRLRLKDDADLAERSDLVIPPATQKQFYPILKADRPWVTKPKLLLISDSFGYTLIKTGALDLLSDNWEFWFYNKSVVKRNADKRPLIASESSSRWTEFDVVILMATEYNLSALPYGFSPVSPSKSINRK